MKYKGLLQAAVLLSNMFFSAAILIIGSIYLGKFLDSQFNTSAVFTVSLSFIGLAASFYIIIRSLMKMNR